MKNKRSRIIEFRQSAPIIKYMSLLSDAMILGALWLFTSLPIITIGTSTTAGYYVMTRRISDRESSIAGDYFSSFKSNFKNTTVIYLILMICILINLYNFFFNPVGGYLGLIINAIQIILMVQLIFVYVTIFPLASRFDLDIRQLFRKSLILANKHVFTTLTHGALFVAVLWLCFNAPVIFVIAPGLYIWFSSYMIMNVYRKYNPEMDKDVPPDTEKK